MPAEATKIVSGLLAIASEMAWLGREPPSEARFRVGDRVLTRAGRVDHHTRLPAYAAGRVGMIEMGQDGNIGVR